MSENYMSRFSSAEEFIRAEVIANRGTKSVVTKTALANDAIYYGLSDDPDKFSKEHLFDLLVSGLGDKAYRLYPVGVSSIYWQRKFDITHKDVLKMAKAGFISATGETEFRLYGRTCFAKTYSPWDYFRLTPEVVHAWLADHAIRKRKKVHNE